MKVVEYYFRLAVAELGNHNKRVQLGVIWFPKKIKGHWDVEKETKKGEPTEGSAARSVFKVLYIYDP